MKRKVRQRAFKLAPVDAFLWVIRIGAIVFIVWGSLLTLSKGFLGPRDWQRLIVFGISQGSVYALIALGYTMVYGVLRFINFAHGEVFMAGAMIGFFAADAMSQTTLWENQVFIGLAIVLVVAVVTSTIVAVLLERIAYRPLRGTARLIPLITSIGASFFLQYAFAGLFGTDIKTFPQTPALSGSYEFLGMTVLRTQAVVIVAAAIMMIGLYWFVEKTKTGKAIRAVSEDQEIAQLMGINVDRTISTVFGVGGAMAGVAGALYLLVFRSVEFRAGFLPGIKAFTAAVLGGIGNIQGAMLGGLTLGMVESVGPQLFLSGLGVPATFQLKDAIAFTVLVLVLIFRPTGILGERVAEERA